MREQAGEAAVLNQRPSPVWTRIYLTPSSHPHPHPLLNFKRRAPATRAAGAHYRAASAQLTSSASPRSQTSRHLLAVLRPEHDADVQRRIAGTGIRIERDLVQVPAYARAADEVQRAAAAVAAVETADVAVVRHDLIPEAEPEERVQLLVLEREVVV